MLFLTLWYLAGLTSLIALWWHSKEDMTVSALAFVILAGMVGVLILLEHWWKRGENKVLIKRRRP